MRSDVVHRSSRVLMHEQFVGNVDKAKRANKDEQQVPESGDSPGVAG